MYKNKSILGLIPARGGSKGIEKKNIKEINGKPLIAWTIEEAKKTNFIDDIYVTSEDEQILNISTKLNCNSIVRPRELALDTTSGVEPVLHAIDYLEKKYDYIILLQPTSPLRKHFHIEESISSAIDNEYNFLVSITETTKSPYWMYKKTTNNLLESFMNVEFITRRQDLPKVYSLNGAIFLAKCNELIKEKKFINENTYCYEMPKLYSMDIDDPVDFLIAEALLKISGNILNDYK